MKALRIIGCLLLAVGALPCAAQELLPSLKRERLEEEEAFEASPREIIRMLDSTERYIPGANHKVVDDYKKRINDPARRFKLAKLSAGTKSEFCDFESVLEKNAEEEFYVRSGDDKILITLFNKQDKATYVDLPPNSIYGIYMQTFSLGGGALPINIHSSDLHQKIYTHNYVRVQSSPKLAEIGDEYYINNICFEQGKAELGKEASRELDRIAVVAIKNPNVTFMIEAYADERGGGEQNRKLATRRLHKILEYLENRHVNMDRIAGRVGTVEAERPQMRCATVRLVDQTAQNLKRDDTAYTVAEQMPPQDEQISFMVQIGAFGNPLDDPTEYYADVLYHEPELDLTYYMAEDGYYKYNVGGVFKDVNEARSLVRRILKYRECYIAAFYKGNRITVYEALKVMDHNG